MNIMASPDGLLFLSKQGRCPTQKLYVRRRLSFIAELREQLPLERTKKVLTQEFAIFSNISIFTEILKNLYFRILEGRSLLNANLTLIYRQTEILDVDV